MKHVISKQNEYLDAAKEAIAELCWPTRCVVCESPGTIICEKCLRALPYLDRWTCCPVCGSPWGEKACVDCNTFTLHQCNRERLPFKACRSSLLYQGAGKRLVRSYKDYGERRIAQLMAVMMAKAIEPAWLEVSPVLCPIPSSPCALRKRDFDHMELVGRLLARASNLPFLSLLEPPNTEDQRKLSRTQRAENMASTIRVRSDLKASLPSAVIVIDDVYTTGSTLYAACDALEATGVEHLFGLTFARVP